MKCSIIISYNNNNEYKKNNLKKLLNYLSWLLSLETEIVLVEQGEESKIDWLKEIKNHEYINHIFVKNSNIFNKGWGYNIGVKESKSDIVIFHEIDIYMPLRCYNFSFTSLEKFDIIKPYKFIHELNNEQSDIFLNNGYNFNIALYSKPNEINNISSGIFIMKKDKYLSINGFDESALNEDHVNSLFNMKIQKLKLSIKTENNFTIELHEEFNIAKPISIVITAYKSQDYIEECMDSIYSQTYFIDNDRFEVLIGVDGCLDTLDKVLDIRSKYKNLRVFMMEKNMGTYVTTNTLVDLAQYENILRFDSDDIMLLDMIKEISFHVRQYNVIRFRYFKLIGNEISDEKKNFYTHGVICFNKTLFDELGGYQPWYCGADSEFLVRGESIMIVKYIDKELFYRRIHFDSLTESEEYGMKSQKRKEYKMLIGKHDNIKINKITNNYDEY